MKICTKCKIEKKKEDFYRDKSTNDKLTCWCKQCRNDVKKTNKYRGYRNKYYNVNNDYREYVKEYGKTLNGKFYRYKARAKHRKQEFNLTFEEFAIFWQKPCHYCGDLIKTIGIDRVDNNKGYELNNCVSCCAICNYGKMNQTREEYIEHCKRVVTNGR